VTVTKSIALFVLAAVFEIGGAWLIWQGVRESRGWWWMGLGVAALGAYGFAPTAGMSPARWSACSAWQ
jgi:small multidrug resistance family-3 protein